MTRRAAALLAPLLLAACASNDTPPDILTDVEVTFEERRGDVVNRTAVSASVLAEPGETVLIGEADRPAPNDLRVSLRPDTLPDDRVRLSFEIDTPSGARLVPMVETGFGDTVLVKSDVGSGETVTIEATPTLTGER